MSPPTGTVMRTTWLYSPVHKTRRNSPLFDGIAAVMLGKYCISCLGGSDDILGSLLLRNELLQKEALDDLDAWSLSVLATERRRIGVRVFVGVMDGGEDGRRVGYMK